MPANWRFTLHDDSERRAVGSRFAAFRDHLGSLDCHRLLSLTSLYTLVGSIGALQQKGAYPEVAELEFLQAIVLSADPNAAGTLPPEEVSVFWRELASQCYVANLGVRDSATLPLDSMSMMHAAYYRNPYGGDFFDRLILTITEEYDDRFLRKGRLVRAGKAIISLRQTIWARFVAHMASWRIAVNGSRPKVLKLLRSFTDVSEADFRSAYDTLHIKPLRNIAYQAVEDSAVRSLFSLDSEWISGQEIAGLPMGFVLDRLSLSAARETGPSELVTENPVWSTPVVKRTGNYSLYSLFTLTSFPFRCLLKLLSDESQVKSRLEKVRGWFVEQEGTHVLKRALPSAQVVHGGFWLRTPNERVETDLLAFVANRLFIVEAKGALIPDRVRVGVRDATVHFLRSIWGKATKQGAALANYLKDLSEPLSIRDKKGGVVMTIDPRELRSISRFSISVEQVGPLMNAPDMLREAGILDDVHNAAPCIILSELEQVFGHARDELHRLHYLLRRCDAAMKHQIVGDELDIYTTYLQYGFAELPQSENALMLLGASYSLDGYRDDAGMINLPTDSVLRCSPYFQRVLDQAKRRQSKAYLELGLMLMDMPYGQQRALEQRLVRTFHKRPKPGEWPIVMTSIDCPGESQAIAIVLVDSRTSPEERRGIGLQVLANASDQFSARQAACIVRLWKESAAYDAIYFGGHNIRSDEKPKNE